MLLGRPITFCETHTHPSCIGFICPLHIVLILLHTLYPMCKRADFPQIRSKISHAFLRMVLWLLTWFYVIFVALLTLLKLSSALCPIYWLGIGFHQPYRFGSGFQMLALRFNYYVLHTSLTSKVSRVFLTLRLDIGIQPGNSSCPGKHSPDKGPCPGSSSPGNACGPGKSSELGLDLEDSNGFNANGVKLKWGLDPI